VIGVIIAFIVGLLFTLWLASRQSDYKPMFSARRSTGSPLWWIAGGAALIGIVVLIYVVVSAIGEQREAATAQGTPSPLQARMLIPSLNINERVVNVPIKDGEWDISRLSGNIGWLEATGVKPDDNLAMAFIGHVTVSSVQKGPFANLWTIKPLSEIIYRNGGVDFVYTVESVSPAKPNETAKLFQRKKEHVLLVTCTDYNFLTEKYDGRLIVDAVLTQRRIAPKETAN
jgi:LPXTG-site transpeptidase (sortase) family protein